MKKNVLISGGSGFIGSHLTGLLIAKGYSVSILSRSEKQNKGDIFYYKWDVANQTIDESA
ncbi:MAG: GDP-mannose 4,6-dehydratase, partial [Bacteroidota bacterium]